MIDIFSRLILCGAACALASCAAVPAPADPSDNPGVARAESGVIIGTVAYPFGADEGAASTLLVRFERLQSPAQQDYLLLAQIDGRTKRGFFAGPLPEGAYAFREASVGGQRLASTGLRPPFEVRAGEVTDLGHFNLNAAEVGLLDPAARR